MYWSIPPLMKADIKYSMDRRGLYFDNIFIERLSHSLKQQAIYLDEIINDLTQAYKNNDLSAVAARGHELKGMTGNFGLMEICHYAGDIEKAVKTKETANIESLINNLPEMKKRAEEALNQWVNS